MSYHANEFLPIRFDFSLARAKWQALDVQAVDWSNSGSLNLLAEIPGRFNRVGKVSQVHFAEEHVPPAVKAEFQSGRIRHPREDWAYPTSADHSRRLTVLECQPASSRVKPRKCDPRKLRDEFLSLKEDTAALLAFLNRYGAWGGHFSFGRWFSHSAASNVGFAAAKRPQTFIVPPHAFWHYRSTLKTRLEEAVLDPARWFASTLEPPTLQKIPEYPFHSYRLSYALDALEASVTFDLLQTTPVSLCAREDCRKPFFITRPGKQFCSEKCARCVVMRRSRAIKKSQHPKGSNDVNLQAR